MDLSRYIIKAKKDLRQISKSEEEKGKKASISS